MKILLVEPDYYTQFPSLPLLKMSAWHKDNGNEVLIVKGNNMMLPSDIDVVNITSLYTFESKPVLDCIYFYKNLYRKARINVGGIFTTLLPEFFLTIEGVNAHVGNIDILEDIVPDYSLVPNCETSIIFASKGCVRDCEFCGTRIIHPKFTFKTSIKKFIMPQHKTITLFDNNFLAHPLCLNIIQELIDAGKPVDITQGLDARLLTKEKAEMLSKLTITPVIFAFDNIAIKDQFIKAIEMAQKYNVGKKSYIVTYMLYSFHDTIEDLIERIQICLDLGVRIFLMQYLPLNLMDKKYNFELDPNWDIDTINIVSRLKNILSTMGTINPASYVYVKFPLPEYVRRLNNLWKFDAASSKTAAQRSLFDANINSEM